METKKELRRKVLGLRGALSGEERGRAEILLTERVLGHQWFYRAEVLLGFMSYGTEIATREILLEALKRGKKVYLPKVEGKEMSFYRITSLEELTEGYKGILEPEGTSEKYSGSGEERVLLLMPGAAFDLYGNRMGYGGGFYDRYLSDKEELRLHSIAVGFRCQLVERLPVEEHDVKPYQVICV